MNRFPREIEMAQPGLERLYDAVCRKLDSLQDDLRVDVADRQ